MDTTLGEQNVTAPGKIIEAIEFCPKLTYITWVVLTNGWYGHEITHIPIVANLFPNSVEFNALKSFTPLYFYTYGLSMIHLQSLGHHLNKQCRSIKFSLESEYNNRVINLLDRQMEDDDSRKFSIRIHRKHAHSDVYSHFNSAHSQWVKRTPISSLVTRVENRCNHDSECIEDF